MLSENTYIELAETHVSGKVNAGRSGCTFLTSAVLRAFGNNDHSWRHLRREFGMPPNTTT